MPVQSDHYHSLNFRPTFCPEHAVAGQKVAILRLNMQIDIKRVSSRTHSNNFTNFKLPNIAPGREAGHRISRCIDAERVHAR